MNTNCNCCNVRVQVDIERLAGIRYCPKCQWRAKATWTLRTAALWAERAGLEEAAEIRGLAHRIAIPGSLTRDAVLGGSKRPRRVDNIVGNSVDAFVDEKPIQIRRAVA